MNYKFVESDLANDFWHYFGREYELSKGMNWIQFIKSLDLGIECVEENKANLYWSYEITNKKKWNYARIKYEF
jgi:hypothetical protein